MIKQSTTPEPEAATAQEPAPDLSAQNGSWVAGLAGRAYDKFFADPARKRELEAFEARESEKARAAAMFRGLTESIEEKRTSLSILNAKISSFVNADVALSIFKGFKTGAFEVEVLAEKMARVVVIQKHGAAILKLATTEIEALEKRLSVFKNDNRDTLKELGLI